MTASGVRGAPLNYLFVYGGGPARGKVVNLTGPGVTFSPDESTATNPSIVWLNVREGVFPHPAHWSLRFVAPSGEVLGSGTYPNAARFADPGVPGLSIDGDGVGCNRVVGEFTVHELTRDDDGTLLTFAATFSQSCTDWSFAHNILSGEIRYASAVDWTAWFASATSFDFGDQPPGTDSPTIPVTLTAGGSLPVSLGASIVGTNADDFDLDDTLACLGTLSPGDTCTVWVTFRPSYYGARSAQLSVTTSGLPAVFGLSLSGNGRHVTTTFLDAATDVAYPGRVAVTGSVEPASSGTVGFWAGGRLLDQGVLINSEVDGEVLLLPGSHELTGRYVGSNTAFPSESEPVSVTVGIATRTELQGLPASVPLGALVTLQASAAGAGGFALSAGSLSIVDAVSQEVVATVPVTDDAPRLAVQVRLLEVGPRQFEARYSGSGMFITSSASLSTTVTALTTAIFVSSQPAALVYPAPQQLLARVHPVPDGGSVTFRVGATILGTAPVDLGTGTAVLDVALTPGSHLIGTAFSGTPRFGARSTCCAVETVHETLPPSPDNVPPSGSLTVAGGASYTKTSSVTLSVVATDPPPGTGVAQMQFSSTGNPGSWASLEPYSTTRQWTLAPGDGIKYVFVRFRDGAGNVSAPASASIVLDTTPPSAVGPQQAFILGQPMGKTSAPVRIHFATADATSGVVSYGLGQSTNGGTSYTNVAITNTSGSATRTLSVGSTKHRFRTRATDGAGNTNAWTAGPVFQLAKVEQSATAVRYSGSWSTKAHSSATGGKYRVTTSAGARATHVFTGRAIAIAGQVGPSAGRADVYLDGVRVASIDLYAPKTGWRSVVFESSFASVGQHTMELRALGTKRPASTGTRVVVDAFLVLR